MKRKSTIFLTLGLLAYGLALYVVPLFFELPAELEQGPPRGLLFTDRNGQPVRRLLDGDLRADEPARFDEFPDMLIKATLAAEDSRFYSHNGIDYRGIARAVRDAVIKRRFVSGASTVTQQTIKLYSEKRSRDFSTKIIEAFTARKLEMFADKETILTAYLNRLPYGNQFTGARAAARGYFGKPLSDLSVAEAALLAGLPNKPSRLNPWRNLDEARRRQLWILQRMADEGYITEVEFASALVEQLSLLPGAAQTFQAPHFVNLVTDLDSDSVELAEASGHPVETTLDLDLQHFVESSAAAELTRLSYESNESNDLQAAVVVIENRTGEVLALTGSRSFFGSRAGQINGAWTPRSPGSTLKPFTYLLALERGFTASTILADTPIEYVTSTGTYQPVNFDRRFNGPVSLRRALANSLNVPAVKTLEDIGGSEVLQRLLVEDLQFSTLAKKSSEYGLGLTLGNAEVRLLELSNAYACLARLGVYRPFQLTTPSTQQGSVNNTTLFDPSAAWLIADILSDEKARVEAFGFNSPLQLPFRAAAKTGTSTDFRDNWTIGYTPEFTVGVWVGRFDNRPLNKISGAIGAAPIFHRVMVRLHEDREPTWYPTPENAVQQRVDRVSGRLAGPSELPDSRTRTEWFVGGQLPLSSKARHYDKNGKTLLPLSYSNWWHSEANNLSHIASLTPIRHQAIPPVFRITSPMAGTTAFLDPDLPGQGSRFPLEITGTGSEKIEWSSPSLPIESEGEFKWVVLKPGHHEVVARDQKTGNEVTTQLTVVAL